MLEKLGRSQYFTALDLAKGFHQIEIEEEDIHKTAFSVEGGHYEFLRLPFELKTAPATLEVKTQIEKEKAIMEKKRTTLRKNALEAMKMVEQRRLRDRRVEGVEDRIDCAYNVGRKQLNVICNEQNQNVADERERRIEIEAKKLNDDEKAIATENECVRRDITTEKLQFTPEEQEKVRKGKVAKHSRIEAYLKEMEQQKEIRRKIKEEKCFDMAQRLKNEEVNLMVVDAQKEERAHKIQEVRTDLTAANPKNIRTNQQLHYSIEELKKKNESICSSHLSLRDLTLT